MRAGTSLVVLWPATLAVVVASSPFAHEGTAQPAWVGEVEVALVLKLLATPPLAAGLGLGARISARSARPWQAAR